MKTKEIDGCNQCIENTNGEQSQICPICLTQKIIRGKWKLVIIWLLRDDKKRFNELNKAIVEITQGYLTQQLRELEEDGLIHREVYKVVPPKVEYSLTKIGKEFLLVMDSMYLWGTKYVKDIIR